ncbi:MAG: LptA/OstA family protein [Alphaproteobacteria bacterium]
MNRFLVIFLSLFFINNSYSESFVKAGDSLIWDSKNQTYTATGDVEFKNEKFIAFSDEMIAQYIEKNNKEIFTIVELFENVIIEFKDEIFKSDYAIYTRDNNIIKLTGNVSVKSPTRLLTGYELIADIDNNKRTLKSADSESLVEVLIDSNANN